MKESSSLCYIFDASFRGFLVLGLHFGICLLVLSGGGDIVRDVGSSLRCLLLRLPQGVLD